MIRGTKPPEVTPAMYLEVFEHHPTGRLILDALARKFSQGACVTGGIDAVLKTYQRIGQREVLDYIGNMMNMALDNPTPTTGENDDDVQA